jgi:subtilisin family serine protease
VKQHFRGRSAFAALIASSVAVGVVSLTGATAAQAEPVPDDVLKEAPAETLGSRDVELLARAESKGERSVTLIIATDKGEAKDVAARVEKLGGSVARRFDKVGYVLAQVPTSRVVKTAKLPGVTAVDLDEVIQLPKPAPDTRPGIKAARQAAAVAGPGAGTPAANPFMPTHEIGAVTFRQKNPTWDGRGVTVGVMDSGVDLDHPSLQTTTTGERKIVDWVTATDPLLENDGTWRPMLTQVSGPTYRTPDGVTFTLPAGNYLFNRFNESITQGGDPAGDVNRDGDTTDRFGILYNPVSHDIRVDANQNLNFTDDAVMRPYKEKFDIGHFGTDDPGTPVREQMPFVVEYREDVDLTPAGLEGQVADFVNIGIVESSHGSHVAGIIAANDMLGNANFDGAAPGAKIVSARACSWTGGCTAAALTTGMVDLVVNRKVQVVNMSIGGLPALNDANNARARLYDRLISDYGVQMFISAGNEGPGLNTIGDPSVASNVVSVAASVSKDTWLNNYGSVVAKPNNLFPFSSRGPREDGGAKPNIAAPGSAISTIPVWQAGSAVPEAGYPLPPGYAMFNGTSMAAPQATGGAALLLSAARATDRGITPAGMRRALYTSAKPIAAAPVYSQGNGMMDVPAAWSLLSKKVETRKYSAEAPVCTPLSEFLATPHKGTGLYNRCGADSGGHKAGQAKTYKVKLTRGSGPNRSIKHNLKWVGNDGTFTSAGTVALPLNKAVTVNITAKPKAGAHGALLRVDDPATSVVDFEVMSTVVAAAVPAKPEFSFSAEGAVDRNSTTSYFVNVPKGAKALQVNLSGIAAGSQTRFIAIGPHGVAVDSTASRDCYMNFSDPAVCKPQERSYENPTPGVWELELESRRTSPMLNNPFEITARVQGATVAPAVLQLPSVPANQPTPVTWTVKNDFGPVVVSGKGGPLGSAKVARPTIANGEHQEFTVEVPAGASRFDVTIGNPSDLAADLDLTVFLGETQVGQSADGDSEESVSLVNPAPGTYRVVVDGFAVPAGETKFDYRDVFYSASLGAVAVPAREVSLANGASTTVAGTVTAKVAPPAGRALFGEMTVVTDEGAVIGRGAVQIGAVTS